MKYSDIGLRAIYRRFCAFEAAGFKAAVPDMKLPGSDKADIILCYGYMDPEAGLSLEVLAAGVNRDGKVGFFEGPAEGHIRVPVSEVAEIQFHVLEDPHGRLIAKHAQCLEALDEFAPSEEIEKTRQMASLDGLRDPSFIDDIKVRLLREGLDPEICKVRITGTESNFLTGTLLEEPQQDFGYHKGETIAFFEKHEENGTVECVSDMNPDRSLTAADLEDGTLLQEAIRAFKKEKTEDNAVEILQLLRDSNVWIPCTADFVNGELKVTPEILRNGETLFMPVYSSEEAMGDHGEDFTKVRKSMLAALDLAEEQEADLYGIVVDAFTDHYILEKDLYDVLREIKSRLA